MGIEPTAQTIAHDDILRVLMKNNFDSGSLGENQQKALRELSSKEIFTFFVNLFSEGEISESDAILHGLGAAQVRCNLDNCLSHQCEELKLCSLEVITISQTLSELFMLTASNTNKSIQEIEESLLGPDNFESMQVTIRKTKMKARKAASAIVKTLLTAQKAA